MTRYTVELTDTAFAAIAEHARYIAIEGRAPDNAQRWLERVWDAIDSLETLPRRAAKAQEDYYVAYEVRQLVPWPSAARLARVLGSFVFLDTTGSRMRRQPYLGIESALKPST